MNRIIIGECRAVMRDLIAQGVKVQTVVTSPPYYGLRDYGIEPSVWGGVCDCAHHWGEEILRHKGGPHGNGVMLEGGRSVVEAQAATKDVRSGCFCSRCGAWRGCLGLEPDYRMFVAHMVEVFDLVRELLAEDGTCWVNLGDSYATGAGAVGQHPGGGVQGERWRGYKGDRNGHEGKHGYADQGAGVGPMVQPNRMPQPGLKAKDRMGMPHRVVFALQDAGWWWRDEIVWKKPNCMPSSQRDRTTCQHEFIFMLTKRERYYYDIDAIKEPPGGDNGPGVGGWATGDDHSAIAHNQPGTVSHGDRVKRTNGKHGARDPQSSGHRIVENVARARANGGSHDNPFGNTRTKRSVWEVPVQPYSGAHFATYPEDLITPCILAGSRVGDIVFDPFMGSGTTAQVAQQLGRQYLGCEANPKYEALQRERCAQKGLALA